MIEWLRCVVLGSSGCGKTSLLHTFMSGSFRSHLPTDVLTTYNVNYIHQKLENFYFKLYDCDADNDNDTDAENDELNRAPADVLVVCYNARCDVSRVYTETELNRLVKDRWPGVPVVLVSLCNDDAESYDEFDPTLLESLYDTKSHLTCSAKRGINVDAVFNEAFKRAIHGYYARTTGLERNGQRPDVDQQQQQQRRLVNDELDVYFGKLFYDTQLTGKQYATLIDQSLWQFLRKIVVTFVTLLFLFGYILVKYDELHTQARRRHIQRDEVVDSEDNLINEDIDGKKENFKQFYELTVEIFDEPLNKLNESYVRFFDSLNNKYKTNQS